MKTKIKEFFKDKYVQKQIVTWIVFLVFVFIYAFFFGDIIKNSFHKKSNAFLFGFFMGMGMMVVSMIITEIIYRSKKKKPQSGTCKHYKKYQFIDMDGNLRCSDCHKIIEKNETPKK